MPRAFLIARHQSYGTLQDYESAREFSPERVVHVAEYGGGHHHHHHHHQQATSDGASECGSESSSDCPDELYNLTKLAEVSLAAANGTLVHPYFAPRNERSDLFLGRIENDRQINEDVRYSSDFTIGNTSLTDLSSSSRKSSNSTTRDSPVPSKKIRLTSATNTEVTSKAEESDDHECPDCGKKYSTSSNLARHRQTHRSLGDKKARRCPHCDKVYVSIPAFSMHVRTHNQGCKCHFCGKCFSRPWLLQGHIRTHTGEKPFRCTICSKAFADKSNLRAHIQTHSNTKPHVCGRCGKAFALKSYLYKHEESSCMRSNVQPKNPEKTRQSEPIAKPPTPTITGSPTSVIVPRPISPAKSSFSSIARNSDSESSRPSVISPNPEHVARIANSSSNSMKHNFENSFFKAASAFSRNHIMSSLNLAMA